ncbi:MAG: tetratricopeptide repeat protein [Candidatus Firestonebacteria bacterium]|nr:tetratricopeptide repeat protein [Candidatus Firestonebacteria bacterium]
MSLKKLKDKTKPKDSFFEKIVIKNLKIWIIGGGIIFFLIIIISGYFSYNEHKEKDDLAFFDKISISYHGVLAKNDEKGIKDIAINCKKLLENTNNKFVKTLAYLYMGNIFQDLKEYHGAVNYYENFIGNSNDAALIILVRLNNGIAYEEIGMLDKAIENYDKALQISNPNYLEKEINLAKARCFEKKGRIEEAKTIYNNLQDSEEAIYRLTNLP